MATEQSETQETVAPDAQTDDWDLNRKFRSQESR